MRYFSPLEINADSQKFGYFDLYARQAPPSILDTPPKSILWMFQMISSLKKNFLGTKKKFGLVNFFKKIQKSRIFIIGVRALIFGPSR